MLRIFIHLFIYFFIFIFHYAKQGILEKIHQQFIIIAIVLGGDVYVEIFKVEWQKGL